MVLDRTQIVEQLKSVFQRLKNGEIDVNKVAESASFAEDLGLDSLDLLEVRFELESGYGVQVSDAEALKLKTVGDVVDLVLARQKALAT
jgi:acyl carrier protein